MNRGEYPMNRNKKLKLNTIVGFLSQVTTFICGFIIPHIILKYYGSEINGLIASITNFLSFISLAECGIGVVVQSSLYKPLADNDEDQISRIIISANRFFSKIGVLLALYVCFISIVYPFIIGGKYKFTYVSTLVIILSISTFIEYYICMSYRLLITADQSVYIILILQIVTQILITLISVLMSTMGASIHVFKLCTSLILFIRPIFLAIYVKKHYAINYHLELVEEPIKQKWNGLAQHAAYVVLTNTDTVVLTLFSTLANVSIYNVYFLVVNGIKMVISSLIIGMQSLLGNMYAKQETESLISTFSIYEWAMHAGVTFLFACTCVLIVPFVNVYTYGINDANYNVPLFGLLISLAQMAYCIRLPYNAMVFAAGHYKQTQNSAIVEAVVNIVISIVCVSKFGLVGVAVGTLVAMFYRTVYLAVYLQNNIIYRNIMHFIKHVIVDCVVIILSILITRIFELNDISYIGWTILAIKVALVICAITLIANFVIYPHYSKSVINKFIK